MNWSLELTVASDIDNNNVIKQRTNSNTTNRWVDGPINKAHFVANDADQVGLQAVWSASYDGDSPKYGITLWYASDNTSFQQLGWRYGDATWTHEDNFSDMNGHAGVGCYTWGTGTVMYSMFVNTKNTVEFYWKDTNTTTESTETHPINKWAKGQSK